MKTLVAEDDPTNQKVAYIWLTRTGHSVTVVPDGQSCVERYRSEKFDVILMDVSMPILGGVEATVAIRQYETENCFPRTPTVAITASARSRRVLGVGYGRLSRQTVPAAATGCHFAEETHREWIIDW